MTVKEYFDLKGWRSGDCTQVFLKQAVIREKDSYPHVEFCYRTTPIWMVWEWLDFRKNGSKSLDAIVLNTTAYADDWIGGSGWNQRIESGAIRGLLVADYETLRKRYCVEQVKDTIEYIDKKIREEIANEKKK